MCLDAQAECERLLALSQGEIATVVTDVFKGSDVRHVVDYLQTEKKAGD